MFGSIHGQNHANLPCSVKVIIPLAGTAPQRMTIARTTRRNDHSPLSRMKSLNYGDNLLARREAIERGYGDALMLNSHRAHHLQSSRPIIARAAVYPPGKLERSREA
jgi:branched-subunit amino acid aminotransferase/4-amino-4-deoxychorismate lyase